MDREKRSQLGRCALLVDGGEGFVGSGEERGGFVEDDGNGDVTEEAFKFPLVLEGVKESAVFHFFKNFYGDSASDVDAADRQNFQCENSGFGTIEGGPNVQVIRADSA